MEAQDMGSKDQEGLESMLTKAASLEKSIIAISNKGSIILEQYYSDLVFFFISQAQQTFPMSIIYY